MNVLITAATELEIAPFAKKNKSAELFIHGVGATHAIYALSKKLNTAYDLVIQAGIAGSFSREIYLGETVLVKRDGFADMGLLQQGKLSSIFEMGLAGENEFPYHNAFLENKHPILKTNVIKTVNAVTVNLINTDENYTQLLREKYQADIETMEGAALHYVCLYQKIPFLQLRSISNYVGERDKGKWKLDEAIHNLCFHLEELVNRF